MGNKILFEKSVVCPCCTKTLLLKYPNPRLYVVAKRESDQHVTEYTWLHGIKTDVIPHYYSVWQCPFCLFADFKENVEDFKRSAKNKQLIDSLNGVRQSEKFNILKGLRRLSMKGHTPLGVLAMHLSAIYMALLPNEKEARNYQKIGRLFLRLAWLYRELMPKKQVETEKESLPESRDRNVLAIAHSIEQCEHHYQSILEELSRMRKAAAERARAKQIDPGGKQDPYRGLIENISDKLKQFRTCVEMARHTTISDLEGKLDFSGGDEIDMVGEIVKKLNALIPLWPEMPLNERKAMDMAVQAFDYSFKYEDADRSNEQGLSLMNLILRIYLRMGDLDRGLNYINQIYKMGFRDKQALQNRITQGKQNQSLSAYDEKMIRKKIGNITMTLGRAGESRRQIFDQIYLLRKEKFETLVASHPNASTQQIESLLIRSGVNEEMIPYLKERGIIKEEKKKGLFGRKG